jgi:hypothetical protein
MSDPQATAPTDPAKPLEVPVKAWPGLSAQGFQAIFLGMCAVGADHFVHRDMLIPTVLAGAGFVGTWLFGAIQHVRAIGLNRALNSLIPDSLARAKK